MARDINLPWCKCGDFNEILFAHGKVDAKDREGWLINNVRHAVTYSGLTYAPKVGYPFTWFKTLGTPCRVEEKLDKALVNDGFQYFLMHN